MEAKNELEFAPVYRGRVAGATMQILLRIDQALQAQRGHLMPWIPVCLGIGIGCFFLLRSDPGVGSWCLLALVSGLLLPLTRSGDARAVLATDGFQCVELSEMDAGRLFVCALVPR